MNRKRTPKKHSSFLVKKKQERELLNKSLNASTEMSSDQLSSILNSSVDMSTQDTALNQTMPDIRSEDIFSSNILDIPVENVIPEENEQKKEDESFDKTNPNPQKNEVKNEKEVNNQRENNSSKAEEIVVIEVDDDGFGQQSGPKGKSIKKASKTKVRSKPRQSHEEEENKAKTGQNQLDVSIEQPKSSYTKVIIVGSIFAIAAAAGVYFYMKSSKKPSIK
ncbi:unnamed protein product [Blepharisma stoltei]|uniref:Uncharacterized protein n=1 Tax=Blepharisma stoltei TaxID=1481888 RepID=A0AAU9IVB9_9CILI|nr:unnamed protein product [Blepharisma stoltei]